MIRCEHCGSVLPDGAIFCGECGRAVNTASSRRTVAPEPVDRGTPPPLQQPDPHGRRSDPAAEAWLPESTLDPATRAWLTGADRRQNEPAAPVPVQTPDSFAPRSAPSHVHGAGSGLGEWTGSPDAADAAEAADAVDAVDQVGVDASEPPLDPDAFPAEPALADDDPEITRVAPRTQVPPVVPEPVAPAESAVPFWAAPEEPAAAPAPSAPSWWIGRATDDASVSDAASTSSDAVPTDHAAATAPDADTGAGAATDDAADAPAPSDDQHLAGTGALAGPESAGPAGPDSDGPDGPAGPESAGPESAGPARAGLPEAPRPGDTVAVEPLIDRRPPRPAPLVQPGSQPTTCHVCGSRLEPDDIFCNECGAVRPAVTAAFTGPVVPLPVARPDWAARDEVADDEVADDEVSHDDELADAAPTDGAPADGAPADGAPTSAAPASSAPSIPASPTAPSSIPAPEDSGPVAPVPTAAPLPPIPGTATIPPAAPLPPVPGAESAALPKADEESVPSSSDADESAQLDEDVDETRIVTKTPTRAPFVLHFSTGERLGVHGTGLLGRLPRPEPGERFDDLLTIHDPGKSVSKTHLEIGRDGDDLWVSDRFSGNGSVIRHIDGSIRRCEPGRRYRVERGARVDVGEQFFLVQ